MVVLSDGTPGIAYNNVVENGVKFARNPSVDGSGVWTFGLIDSGVNGPRTNLVVLSDGTPGITYNDSVGSRGKFIRNSSPDGSGTWTDYVISDDFTPIGQRNILVTNSGYPMIIGVNALNNFVSIVSPFKTSFPVDVSFDIYWMAK